MVLNIRAKVAALTAAIFLVLGIAEILVEKLVVMRASRSWSAQTPASRDGDRSITRRRKLMPSHWRRGRFARPILLREARMTTSFSTRIFGNPEDEENSCRQRGQPWRGCSHH